MQVADRFQLHQNLLEAITKALNREIPATTVIKYKTGDPKQLSQDGIRRSRMDIYFP
jgi:hypothetical protein